VNFGATSCKRQNPCGKDLHPCDGDRGGCHIKRTCAERGQETFCRKCPAGFVEDGPKGCKEIEGTVDMVCNDQMGELWVRENVVKDYDACIQDCKDAPDCLSIGFYTTIPYGRCSHFSTMCKELKPRAGVISKNVKGESLNKRECDVSRGEKYIGQLGRGSTKNIADCEQRCQDHGQCNSFVYYDHGTCSFFSTCCANTHITENAHTMRWRIPEP